MYKKKYAKYDQEDEVKSGSDNDEEENQDEVDIQIQSRKNVTQGKAQRSSVSAEVYGMFNEKKVFVPKVVPKNSEQKQKITDKVLQSFLFNTLEDKDLNAVVDAMEERRFAVGDTVIKQGDAGAELYVVFSGKLKCTKVFSKEKGDEFLKYYVPGEAFGELALLYNAPRQATILAEEDCILYSLDRETFNHIVKDAAVKKREKYEHFLKGVDILSSIHPSEITQISDALTIKKVSAGTDIIKQGEEGDMFYILEDGKAYAHKMVDQQGN
jgi:cAMP-dependent protein kinase regulator